MFLADVIICLIIEFLSDNLIAVTLPLSVKALQREEGSGHTATIELSLR